MMNGGSLAAEISPRRRSLGHLIVANYVAYPTQLYRKPPTSDGDGGASVDQSKIVGSIVDWTR